MAQQSKIWGENWSRVLAINQSLISFIALFFCRAKMVQPLVKVKSVKKRTNPFKRHQCDRKIAVKVRIAATQKYITTN